MGLFFENKTLKNSGKILSKEIEERKTRIPRIFLYKKKKKRK